MTKKKNVQDATLININALKKRVSVLEKQNNKLMKMIKKTGEALLKVIG